MNALSARHQNNRYYSVILEQIFQICVLFWNTYSK
jgi:hypothetical protein